MKKKFLSLILALTIVLQFIPVSVYAQENKDIKIYVNEDENYVDIIESGEFARITEYVENNERVIEVTDTNGNVIKKLKTDIQTNEIFKIENQKEVSTNLFAMNTYSKRGSEENPYVFCSPPGSSSDYRSYSYTLRQINSVVGDVTQVTAIIAGLASLSGVPLILLTKTTGIVGAASWLVSKSDRALFDKYGIKFNSRKVCGLGREFDAGEYVYYYQNSINIYNVRTFG